ncbi:putative quinol monooxygenase [Pedobacter sp. ASV12]|uniref:putative quinol monooxygenase n=1 Tax=Pedobacter sp. ASV12 TaxID=2795120 RepID=UPI0018EC086D|nr:antibiotic biosynthesis monooxygenase family protein [Pedobacter sp. ASV12]
MLVRVVKMHFEPGFIDDFKTLFSGVKSKIKASEGCEEVKLLQHESEPSIFFTISYWQSAYHLEKYRNSDLFKETWAKVKPNFAHKAEAWSLNEF